MDELYAREQRLAQSSNPVHAFDVMRLRLLLSPSTELTRLAQSEFHELLQVPLESQPETKVFANAGAHLIERSGSLIWRHKLPFILCQIAQDPKLQRGDIAHLQDAAAQDELAFRSANGLSDGIYLMDAYTGPLLAALAPSVWGFNVPRSFGSLIFSLGQPLAGSSNGAEEMLHHIGVPGRDRSRAVPRLSSGSSHAAVRWWSESLNTMFAVLSDYSVFTDAAGRYLPKRHVHALLTIEQLFRRTTSALVSERDTNARRVLMFSALDTVERLTTVQLDRLADLKHAQKTLAAIEMVLPFEAAAILLPGARGAVEALEEMQEGFFIQHQLGTRDIELQVSGAVQATEPGKAAALYIKALRDATHGHGARRESAADRTDALIAQHDGQVPHDLGLLAYLYLLELLVRPNRLRGILKATCRKGRP